MADIKAEIQSRRDFVAPELTGVTFQLQNMSETYKANVMSIEFGASSPTSETAYHYRLNRTYQLVYFGTSKLDCVTKMQAIERKINDKQDIEIGSTGRYLRVASFSLSNAFKTETTGVYAVIGMLEAKVREPRTQENYEPINNVTVNEGREVNGN